MKIGYARVSTDAQDYSAQVEALRAAGAEKIVSEKMSGATLDRRSLRGLIERLGAGDQLIVTRLDRLAPSTRDPLHTIAARSGERRGGEEGRTPGVPGHLKKKKKRK